MYAWSMPNLDTLWQIALTALPLGLLVALLCRMLPCRPTTRHLLWLVVLGWLLVAPFIPDHRASDAARAALAAGIRSLAPPPTATTALDQHDRPIPVLDAPARTAQPSRDSSTGRPVEVASVRQPAGPASAATSTAPSSPAVASRSSTPIAAAPATTTANSLTAPPVHSHTQPHPARPADKPKQVPPTCVSESHATANGTTATTCEHAAAATHPAPPPATAEMPIDHGIAPAAIAPSATPDSRFTTSEPADAVAAPPAVAAQPDRWLPRLAAAVAAVRRIPPLPAVIWLTGSTVVLLLFMARTFAFRHRLRRARPAPEDIVSLVAKVSRRIGLKTPPQAFVVEDRLSPLVCGGRRARLILPRRLWAELDDTGRCAILCHELAHLRRCDHVVRCGELLASVLYWWHPVVWWVRIRLHEESELCCDAWVTWLMPHGRRAYAEALLTTRRYLSTDPAAAPVGGLAVTTARTRTLARRIKMVMTERMKPGLSYAGSALVLTLALTAWLAAPAQSCPPEEETPTAVEYNASRYMSGAPSVEVRAGRRAPVTAIAPVAPIGVIAQAGPPAPPTPTAPRAGRSAWSPPGTTPGPGPAPMARGGALEERMARLEENLARLAERLEHLDQRLDGGNAFPATRNAIAGQQSSPFSAPVPDDGGKESRMYAVSPGKLEALVELMARQDVPVFITAHDDGIEVHATPAQHEIFGAFVRMIDPKDGQSGSGQNRVGAAAAQEAAMLTDAGLAAQMGEPSQPLVAAMFAAREAQARASEELRLAQLSRRTATATLLREGMSRQLQELRAHADQMRARQKEIEAQAELLERQAEELEEQADQMREEAEGLREHGGDTGNEKAQALEQRAEELAAESLRQQEAAGRAEVEAESIESLVDGLVQAIADLTENSESHSASR